jgi:outer membrane protein assembly factor BamE (lipoprotein component of BamABCDE complex)
MPGKSLHIYLRYVLLSAICTGCMIPVSYYTPGSRRNVQEKTALTIIPGQTTREEVLAALGAPDQVSPNGSQMVYSWEKVKAIGGFGYGYGEAIQRSNLVITFDERNVVVQREIEKKGFPTFW